ncbi:MAG: glycosyltransferase family 9 protein [Ignavibacteriales bacterium]
MILKKDCRFFSGDKPCHYHKENGIKCDDCNYYQPISNKILIIKLDAVGDVLRTTSILIPLKKKYPKSYIVWCTKFDSKELFQKNSLVDEIIIADEDARFRLQAEDFDIIINLDTSKLSSSIAALASGKNKIGFVLDRKGFVEATSKEAEQWLEMSAFDDVKKANQKSYQQIMYEILELNLPVHKPVIHISESIKARVSRKSFFSRIKKDKPTIGLNVGVGPKWPSKGWPIKRWNELINQLNTSNFYLLLLGGPAENQTLTNLSEDKKYLINSGSNNSLLEFAAIVDLCDIIVTADTLTLHIATALDKNIVALFGPTSANEIELYGKGIKLIRTDECKCYYRNFCTEEISCMEKISSVSVVDAINSLLK